MCTQKLNTELQKPAICIFITSIFSFYCPDGRCQVGGEEKHKHLVSPGLNCHCKIGTYHYKADILSLGPLQRSLFDMLIDMIPKHNFDELFLRKTINTYNQQIPSIHFIVNYQLCTIPKQKCFYSQDRDSNYCSLNL